MALYSVDGSMNITVVDGNTRTGLFAPDGSMYVVVADGTVPVGMNHPSGARWVTVSPGGFSLFSAPDGSMYVSESPYTNGGVRVTVVSGSLGADITAPTITSSNAINLVENVALSHTLTANEAVTWTKTGGADQALFTLVGSNLSMTSKDFEIPADADLNNTYVVQVTATDGALNATNQTITVTITDVSDVSEGDFLLLADGTSFLLLANGTDRLLLAGSPFEEDADHLLLADGSFSLLLANGIDKLLLADLASGIDYLLDEDGINLLDEDGEQIAA